MRCWWTTGRGDGAAGDGIGARAASITTTSSGVAGQVRIGRRVPGIDRGRSCGPTVRAMAATGGIARQTIVRPMLPITARATIVRLTGRVTGQAITREIVPVAIGRQTRDTDRAHQAGQQRNRFDRIAHRSSRGRIVQIRADLIRVDPLQPGQTRPAAQPRPEGPRRPQAQPRERQQSRPESRPQERQHEERH